MAQFTISSSFPGGVTFLSNRFLDDYMPSANGEFVKIYLYLLRSSSAGEHSLALSGIADVFNCTEADIIRALKYWQSAGVLDVAFDSNGTLTSVSFCSLDGCSPKKKTSVRLPGKKEASAAKEPMPDKAAPAASGFHLSPDKLKDLKKNQEVRQILFVAERYLGKTLSPTDIETLLYLYEEVPMSYDLMEYLLEYCVSKGSTSMAYIKKVGLSWAEKGIATVQQAMEDTNLYNKNYFTILKAFGISSRNPLEKEIQYMNLWLNQYGFTLDIISEACSRTVLATGKASFSYADSILESWFKKGVHHLSDVESLDKHFQQKRTNTAQTPKKAPAAQNRFNNFHQRSYNMDELEKQFLNN